MKQLTSFQRDLMVVTAGLDAPNGLEIKAELEEYYHTEIHHGRLYPNLDTLVEKGLINKGNYDDRANRYTLTDEGRQELEERMEWERQQVGAEEAITESS